MTTSARSCSPCRRSPTTWSSCLSLPLSEPLNGRPRADRDVATVRTNRKNPVSQVAVLVELVQHPEQHAGGLAVGVGRSAHPFDRVPVLRRRDVAGRAQGMAEVRWANEEDVDAVDSRYFSGLVDRGESLHLDAPFLG